MTTGLAASFALSSLGSVLPSSIPEFKVQAQATQPNIIFMLLDDTSPNAFSFAGNTFNETPNIDKIAEEGLQFADFYVQPVCSPTRGQLLTGYNPLRNNVSNYLDDVSQYLCPDEFETLPQMLNRAGYHTGLLGKWHLSAGNRYETTPGKAENHKWNEVILSDRRPILDGYYFAPYAHLPHIPINETRPQGKFLIDDMNERAVEFIEKNGNEDKPFMLYYSHYATHTVLNAPQSTLSKYQAKRGSSGDRHTSDRNPYLAAMMEHIDDGVKMIDDKLEEMGIKDNTLLVIASDNGGDNSVLANWGLRGGKRQIYEGGIKSPLILRWPDVIQTEEPFETSSFPASMTDFYLTFAEAAGLDIENDEVFKEKRPWANSGVSLMPIINKTGVPDRDVIYTCYPRMTEFSPGYTLNNNTELIEGGAIRKGDYKYLQSFAFDRRELYNLADDPEERNNIIEQNPEKHKELVRLLHEYIEKDTIDKVFNATFASSENYRWQKRGSFAHNNNGVCTTSGRTLKVMTVGDFLYHNAVAETKLSADSAGSAGIVFRSNLATPNNPIFKAYAAVLNINNNSVDLLKLKGNDKSVIASVNKTLTPNTEYDFKVSYDSDEIKIEVNGELVLTHYDESIITGNFGLISDNGFATYHNLTVKGIERTRPITAQQLNVKPDNDILIKADEQWVHFDEAPVKIGDETFVQANKLLSTLNINFSYDNELKELTASRFGNSLKCKVGSTAAELNGNNVTLPNAPIETNDQIMVPLNFIANSLMLQVVEDDDIVNISTDIAQSFPCNHSAIRYSGTWTNVANTRRSTNAGAAAELTFEGVGIELYLDRGNAAGIFDVYIDGNLVGSKIDAYNADGPLERSLMFRETSLSPGTHTIRVVNTGTNNGTAVGTNLNIHEFRALKVDVNNNDEFALENTVINFTQSPPIQYTGSWEQLETTKRSTTGDEYCELDFYGYGIKLQVGRGPGASIMEVFINGESMGEIDNYRENPGAETGYENYNLPLGNHTIKVVNTGRHNTSGNGATNLNINHFEVFSRTLLGNNIINFTIPEQVGDTIIYKDNKMIHLKVPFGTELSNVIPTIGLSPNTTVSPLSGAEVDLSSPQKYTVTTQDGTTSDFTVIASFTSDVPSNAKDITSFAIPEQVGETVINQADGTIAINMPFSTDITALTPVVVVSNRATISPVSGVVQNFTTPQTYTVTAENGTTKEYTVTVNVLPQDEVLIQGVTLNRTSLTLNRGVNSTLTATVNPTTATNVTRSWSSSRPSVATIDSNGRVTAVARGTAVITFTATGANNSSFTATCNVTVNQPATGVSVRNSTTNLNVGKQTSVNASVTPSNANVNTKITYRSENTKIATVSSSGRITGKSAGRTNIVVTGGGKTVRVRVNVKSNVTRITFKKSTISSRSRTVNLAKQIRTITPATSFRLSTKYTWVSSNRKNARVSSKGVVTRVRRNRTTTITVRHGKKLLGRVKVVFR